MTRPARAWCWGAGWDSSAGIIEEIRRGIPIDLITFADHGGEKRRPDRERGEEVGTYEFIPLFSDWVEAQGYPRPVICRYQPQPETHQRYADVARRVARHLRLRSVAEADIQRLAGIYGNMVANATLPGIAFGMKTCSVKWKIEAQEPSRIRSEPLRQTWLRGDKVEKCIGFDATEDHRVAGGGDTYAVGNFAICPDPELPAFKDRYDVKYPLREYGFNRARCGEIIRSAGLPIPPKSACFFCPAMRLIEIRRLAKVDPDFYILAIAMELLYRNGKHFRGDNYWTVKAKRKETGEKEEMTTVADDAADARYQFRRAFNDLARPHRYELRVYPAVPGLGRNFAWLDVEVDIPDNDPFERLAVLAATEH